MDTVYLEGFPEEELLNMIDHAYDTVLHSFSKKIQRQILTADEIEIRPLRPEFAISVKKEFRQQGIGSKLMQEMIGLLKNKGYKNVSLSVNKDNYAYRMYQKLGFQVLQEQDEDDLMVLELQELRRL